jgi:hypothetical protein
MRLGWGRRAARGRVEALADAADELAVTSPGTGAAIDAARRAVEAAELSDAGSGPVEGRRLLLRTLWRLASAYVVADDFVSAAPVAERCWDQCLRLLDATTSNPEAFDEAVGVVVAASGSIGPVLATVRGQEDADRMLATCVSAAARASGPRGRQARARLAMADLSQQADDLARARIERRGNIPSGALDHAIGQARDAVAVLRVHAAEGPFETTDLARMLQVLSRLETVAGRLATAADTLDEAIAVMTPIAGRGPTLAWVLRTLRAERDGLSPSVPSRDAAGRSGGAHALSASRALMARLSRTGPAWASIL